MASIKAQLRRHSLTLREGLSDEARLKGAHAVAHHILALKSDWHQNSVAGFWPIGHEIDVRVAMRALEAAGASLALPDITQDIMVWRAFSFAGADSLVDMAFSTKGPGQDCPQIVPTVILAPLAVFDYQGNRIGYGAGFYDRAIAALHKNGVKPDLIGVGFSCQGVEFIPADGHDIPLDGIITEHGLMRFNKG